MHKGRFIGVGVGPGDPELMTLKAVKAIEDADVLMLPSADKTSCRAYQTAYKACRGMDDKECMFEPFPMKMDKEELELFHKMIAGKVESVLDEGKDVVFLTIGDTCVYSTYDYVERLVGDDGYETLRISGVPSFVAAAGRLDMSLGDNGRPIHIIPGNGNIEEAIGDVEMDFEWMLDVTRPMYNVLGQRVDEHYRGLIIQNGHKYLVY